jgi:Cu/Ag efflux pump CusA
VLPLAAPTDLATVPVSGAPGHLPLGRVTTVVEGHQPLIGDAIIDGRSGLVLEVQKLPSASVLGVTKGIDRTLQELHPTLGGVRIDTSFFRPATYLSSARHNLWLALIVGAALALVALAALLLDARSAFVAAASLATSLVVAALVLKALGETLNALVVLGLLAAAALVVDDAVGGTHRMLTGVSEADPDVPLHAVIVDACAEFRSTLGYGTLIVLLCTLPVFFAKGLTATFVHPMFLAFAVAVIASCAIALTVTPALGMLMYGRSRSRRAQALARRVGETYARALRWALAIPRVALAGVCCVGLAGLVAFPFLKPPSPPTFVDRNLVIEWDGPAGTSLPEMDRVTTRVIDELRALPSVSNVAATIGRAVSADRIVGTNSGQIYVSIRRRSNYGRAVSSIRNIVEETPGMYASVSTYEGDVIGGVLAPAKRDLVVRVYGADYGQLSAVASHVQTLMRHVRGLGAPQVALAASEPNIEITVNDAAALRAGVLPGDARRQASTLVSGLTVGNFFEDQAVFDVVVQGVPSVRASLNSVRDLLIDTSGGGHVQLGQIATVGTGPDPIDIQHEALARYVDVTAPVQGGTLGAARASITRKLARLSFPVAYHAEVLGGTPDDPTSHLVFLSYALAGLVGILLLFQAAFDSWRLAAGLLLTVPVTLAGGLLFALLTGQLATLGADAGLLAVLAFAVRQGMLQVAHIRRLQTRLGGTLNARVVVQAASERLAPSVGGALVAAMALLPFAVMGNVAGNEMTHTAAGVIIAGVITATLLNQLYVPALCLALRPAEPALVSEPLQDGLGIAGLPAPTA